ncbi:AMP-binding protein [Nocardia africana]|uniref:Long-chain-fatty-acid--CoA ligase n=1 Tax=Nocardia africana TaxID=134964 RepID=A0A378WVM6_9NOCA|nr:AMP-binding protein [Nocardia africana]MCC3313715.1 AMP-binding protein [Nocardia africana]SUA44902.1 Long-chain-fatty-acid--CoA ligase [Nocardia africana]
MKIAADEHSAGPLHDLAEALANRPAQLLIRSDQGDMTVTQFAAASRSAANFLRGAGIRKGDRVAVMAANSIEHLAVVYGIWLVGGVEVAVNTELRGPLLRHVLADSDPTLVIVDKALRSRVEAEAPALPAVALEDVAFTDSIAPTTFGPRPRSSELASLLYTSGTTGPSKGVMIPHGYYSYYAAILGRVVELSPADVTYFCLPFFHVDAHIAVPASLQHGSAFAFVPRFSVSGFWRDLERFEATWFGGVGAMLSALINSATPPSSVLQRLRLILAAPVPEEAFAWFTDRHGVPILQMYGQTEANGPIYSSLDDNRRGAMGKVRADFDISIVGPDGNEAPDGTVGQMLTRPRRADIICQGYWQRPSATDAAFADGWFHTGDLVRRDSDGFFWYAGRLTDSLRRRGENVSAYELESVVRSAPGVLECAAIGVTDALGGEDEIKVFLVVDDEAVFDPITFRDFCAALLPRFAVPRYVQLADPDSLVRGPGTGAIQKHLLDRSVAEQVIDLTRC